jgi:ankyrin repeat protein
MIDGGAGVHERSRRDSSPLECTLYALYDTADTVDVLKLLLCCGADPNDRDERGRAILHHVARIKWCRTLSTIVKLLLGYGADPRATDSDGNTPLEAAANANMLEESTVKAFKKAGYAGAAECAERGRAKYQACLDFDE